MPCLFTSCCTPNVINGISCELAAFGTEHRRGASRWVPFMCVPITCKSVCERKCRTYKNNRDYLLHSIPSFVSHDINRYWLIWLYTVFGYDVKWEGGVSVISYDNLWNVMKKRGISQYALIKQYNISPGQITRLKRNESVSTHTIEIFCKILDCKVSDIMEYIPDDE